MRKLPTFAIIGHPNEGKSSVVATLAENESVRISPIPGETVRLERFDLKAGDTSIIEFVDTPGFQNPHKTLAWFKEHESSSDSLAARFIEEHQADKSFRHDCELMKPIAEGAGVIYVVDGSRPMTSADEAEMEILRLTGRPRMAVLNRKVDDDGYLEIWKAAFRKSFNSIRVFDACAATFDERLGLVEALKSIDQDWSPALEESVDLLKKDRERRLDRVAEALYDLIEQALTYRETKLVSRESDLELARPRLTENYRKGLAAMEKRAWSEIQRQFRHERLRITVPEASILQEDLFSEKTWQAFGLTGQQLAWAATVAGAGFGAGLDLLAGGASFGIFTAAGAALSGGAALLKGRELAKLKIKRIPVGGFRMQLGPNQNEQFPFILLDRALLFAQLTSNWAHARQDGQLSLLDSDLKAGASSGWEKSDRALCLKLFIAIQKGQHERVESFYPRFKELVRRELLRPAESRAPTTR